MAVNSAHIKGIRQLVLTFGGLAFPEALQEFTIPRRAASAVQYRRSYRAVTSGHRRAVLNHVFARPGQINNHRGQAIGAWAFNLRSVGYQGLRSILSFSAPRVGKPLIFFVAAAPPFRSALTTLGAPPEAAETNDGEPVSGPYVGFIPREEG